MKTDLTNNTYGRLTVIKELPPEIRKDKSNGLRRQWQCICSCNKIVIIGQDSLLYSGTQSCGCLRREAAAVNMRIAQATLHRHKPEEANAYRVYNYYRKGTTNLTFDQFYELSQMNCHHCNSPPSNKENNSEKYKHTNDYAFTYNGLDKINNAKGHPEATHDYNNVLTSCAECNYSRRNMPLHQFYEMIYNINMLIDNKPLNYINLYKQNKLDLSTFYNRVRFINSTNYSDIDFDINILFYIFTLNCFYCGNSPQNTTYINKDITIYHNGLDRLDQNKPHHINNIVPCCKFCNFSKAERSCEEFKSWAKRCYCNLLTKELIPELY